ncbi:hypothetical protein MWU59_03225 [Flavobacteriaceae bacterium F08102]|nr:hypothetical protein [Flavobacteriaceae bacterium F08102]
MIKQLRYLFLFVVGVISAQESPKVTAKADTTKIRIGEQIHFEISVDNTEKGVIFDELKLDSLGKIEVVEDFDIDTLKNRLIKRYLLTSFDSGSYTIPSQEVRIWSQAQFTDPVKIDVSTVAIDTIAQPMFPIKGVQEEPFSFRDFLMEYLWWIIGGVLLLAAILYLIFRKKKTAEEIEVRIPPYELALRRLHELDHKQLWQKNKVKQYYSELSDIVRNFIERELSIPALESTTDELVGSIEDFKNSGSIKVSDEAVSKLERLLKESDLVKFAKYQPLSNEIELHRSDAEKVIEMLHPKEQNDDEIVG